MRLLVDSLVFALLSTLLAPEGYLQCIVSGNVSPVFLDKAGFLVFLIRHNNCVFGEGYKLTTPASEAERNHGHVPLVDYNNLSEV